MNTNEEAEAASRSSEAAPADENPIAEKIEQEYTAIARRNDLYRWITIGVYILIVTTAGATIFVGFRYVNSRLRSLDAQITEQQEKLAKQQVLTQTSIKDVSDLSEQGLRDLGDKLPQLKQLFETTYLAQAQRIKALEATLNGFKDDVNGKLAANAADRNDLRTNLGGLRNNVSELGSTLSQHKRELDATSQLVANTKRELQQNIATTASASDEKTQSAKAELKGDISRIQASIQQLNVTLEKANALSTRNKGEIEALSRSVEQLRGAVRHASDTERTVQELKGRLDTMSEKVRRLEAAKEQTVTKPGLPGTP